MGCTPTSRKRTIVPAGQANPVGLSVHQSQQKGKVNEVKQLRELTSLENMLFQDENKQNKGTYKSVKMTSKALGVSKSNLGIDDIIIKEQRHEFVIEKMDFSKRQHLMP